MAKDSERERAKVGMVGARNARLELLGVPQGLKAQEAEAFAAARLVDLSPYAVAEMEYQLMYGNDKMRSDAARDILDRAGFGKKSEGGGMGGPVIVVNLSGDGKLPWMPKEKMVNGTSKEVGRSGAAAGGAKVPPDDVEESS
jgi:hypothetical protein